MVCVLISLCLGYGAGVSCRGFSLVISGSTSPCALFCTYTVGKLDISFFPSLCRYPQGWKIDFLPILGYQVLEGPLIQLEDLNFLTLRNVNISTIVTKN